MSAGQGRFNWEFLMMFTASAAISCFAIYGAIRGLSSLFR